MERYLRAILEIAVYIAVGAFTNVMIGGDAGHVPVIYLIVVLGIAAIRREQQVIVLQGGLDDLRDLLARRRP